MQESSFVENFKSTANAIALDLDAKIIIKRHVNLFYSLSLGRNLKLAVKDTQKPMRGSAAFQIDICVFEETNGIEFPRIAIEFKESVTTHDVLTYSAKAGKHKQIYPWLRYGLLAGAESSIPGRFFTHNEHLDFFIAAQEYRNQQKVNELVRGLLKREWEISKTLEEIHFDGKKVDYYSRDIVFKNLGATV